MARRARGQESPAREEGWSPEELAALAVRHGLAEIEVERAGTRIRIVREHPPVVTTAGVRTEAGPAAAAAAGAIPVAEAAVTANLVKIEAPMVGTFYRAPSPGAAPFVNEGDTIKAGQVLCIIEAMKLLNEIEAKVAGRVVKVLADNAQPVEYGQPLFLLEPVR